MKIDNITILLVLIIVVVLLYMASSYKLTCGQNNENYLSLPFAGGDIRTYSPDPHRIEGRLGRAMDESDMSGGYPL